GHGRAGRTDDGVAGCGFAGRALAAHAAQAGLADGHPLVRGTVRVAGAGGTARSTATVVGVRLGCGRRGFVRARVTGPAGCPAGPARVILRAGPSRRGAADL